MNRVLVARLREAERLNTSLAGEVNEFRDKLSRFQELPGYSEILQNKLPQINIGAVQRDIFGDYEGNPVLADAIDGRRSVEDALTELIQSRNGIRRFLPRRKDSTYNERAAHVGELVGYPHGLTTRGIWFPDNFVTGSVWGGTAMLLAAYLGAEFLITQGAAESLAEFQRKTQEYKEFFLKIGAPFVGAMIGVAYQLTNGQIYKPTDDAKYLDGKVTQFFR